MNEEKIVGEMLPAESLLQVNKRSALRSRALLHKLDVGKKGKGGEKCKKNDDCQSNKCIKNTFSANKCDFEEGRKRQGKYSSEGAAREWSTVVIAIVIFMT